MKAICSSETSLDIHWITYYFSYFIYSVSFRSFETYQQSGPELNLHECRNAPFRSSEGFNMLVHDELLPAGLILLKEI